MRTVRGLIAATFLLVPLACAASLRDQFTTAKWYVLEGAALALFCIQVLGGRAGGGLELARRHRWLVASIVGLATASCLRSGWPAAVEPLVERASVSALVLGLLWAVRRDEGVLRAIAASTGLAAAATAIVGLGQLLGFDPLPWLTAGDHRSAFFGNVNMATQFLGFAVVLAYVERSRSSRIEAASIEALVSLAFAYAYLVRSRSVMLALAVVTVFCVIRRKLPAAFVARTTAAAAVWVLLVSQAAPRGGPEPSLSALGANKGASSSIRLALWSRTLALVADNPVGVGAGHFGDRLVAYSVDGPLVPSEALLYRSPHNEYLRIIAEEGWLFGALCLVFLLRLAAAVRSAEGAGVQEMAIAPLVIYGAIEAFFQFPLGTPVGCSMAALTLALALKSASPRPVLEAGAGLRAWVPRMVAISVAAITALGLFRLAASDVLLARARGRRAVLEEACALNARNLEACVLTAWMEARDLRPQSAQRRLEAVLAVSPRYFPAIKLRGEIALSGGDRETGCFSLWMYDRLFRRVSSARRMLLEACSADMLARFERQMAVPWYGSFPRFLGGAGGPSPPTTPEWTAP